MSMDKEEDVIYWLRKAAQQGYANAQYELAIRLFMHEKKNQIDWFLLNEEEEARRLLQLASDQEYAEAQNKLGELYFFKKDYDMAFLWFRRAAEQKNLNAMYNVSAIYWFRKEADKAFPILSDLCTKPDAKGAWFFSLGVVYEENQKNMEKAIECFKKAFKLGYSRAATKLDRFKENPSTLVALVSTNET